MMAESQSDTATAQVLAEFKKRMTPPPGMVEVNEALRSYRDAAAVLHVFDPRSLRPIDGEFGKTDALSLLFGISEAAPGWRSAGYRSLKLAVRRAALKDLVHDENVAQALLANPKREPTAVQRMFERWAAGTAFELDQLNYAELEALLALHDWELPGLPEYARVDAARRKRSTIALFEHLITPNFVGRQSELGELRRHVGIEPNTILNKLMRKLSSAPVPPLLLCGPGGVGKTALLGKFLSEYTGRDARAWFPFSFLAFDSQTLDITEPFTILIAAAAQLQSQMVRDATTSAQQQRISQIDDDFDRFRAAVTEYRNQRGTIGQRARNRSTGRSSRLEEREKVERGLQRSFGELLQTLSKEAAFRQKSGQVPIALLLDTFEEVQYSSIERLSGFAKLIENVQATFPGLRVIISGRGSPEQLLRIWPNAQVMQLKELGVEESVALLARLGIKDADVAHTVAQQVGGSPLSLRLAARVLDEEKATRSGIENLETRRFWLFSLAPELIRGQLYRRILAHIHDDGVRALAHPGMVVRRVTADIIEKVLAPACKIPNVDASRANYLFEELRKEHALVSVEADDSLSYREDVRTPMLRLLAHEHPRQVTAIHRAAVEYYSGFDDLVSRAEEIYHGLMLDLPAFGRTWLSQRWLTGVETILGPALEEFPARARLLLASHMSIELPKQAYDEADLEEWESIFGRKAIELLRYGQPKEVRELLGQRMDRTADSPLYAIEVRALIATGEHSRARALLQRALAGYPALGNPGRLAELLWLDAQVETIHGLPLTTLDILWRLETVASGLSSKLPYVQALTEEIDVCEILNRDNSEARRKLAEALAGLPDQEVTSEPSVIRLALVRAGPEFPLTIMRLAPMVTSDLAFAPAEDIQRMQAPAARVLGETPDLHRPMDEQRLLVSRALTQLFAQLRSGFDQVSIELLLDLIRQEETTLAGSSLPGLDDYREEWELGVSELPGL
jgi:hypothetical protein